MDITKITFDEVKFGVLFEDLDVNNDGKINDLDYNAAKDSKIKAQIQNVLNDVDDDATVASTKTSASKNKYGFDDVNEKEFKNILKNSKGTVYLVMGNLPSCGLCVNLANEMKKNIGKLNEVSTCYNIQWNDNNSYCWGLYKQIVKNASSVKFPAVAKFVDGKLVDIIPSGDAKKNVQKMISGAVKSTETTDTTTNENKIATTNNTVTSSAKTSDDIKKAAEDLKTKYLASGTLPAGGDKYSLNNPELAALKKALEGGAIEALSKEGFSKEDIIKVIEQAFPTVGIKQSSNGGYSCPYGHGADAKALYNEFIKQISAVTSSDVVALEAEIKELNAQISNNNNKLNTLKASIEILQKEAQKAIEDAIKESEEIAEEQKEKASDIVNEEMERYASSEGELTYDDFKNSISRRLDNLQGDSSSKLSAVVLKLVSAESKISILGGYLKSFENLVNENKTLATKVKEKVKAAEAAAENPSTCDANRCDPIGFSANGVAYDFFVDNDKNGQLSNETEFLGAKNGWSEMAALDTNNDGKVSVSEMGDLMLVSKDANGNQVVKKASELFNSTDTVDLSSYKAINKDFADGNTLLGSFSLSFNGSEVKNAYNTMDTLAFLDANYEFTDKDEGINRFAQGNTTTFEINNFEKEYSEFVANYEKLETSLVDAWQKTGIKRADIKESIDKIADKATENDAKEVEELFKKKTAQEQTAAQPENNTPQE